MGTHSTNGSVVVSRSVSMCVDVLDMLNVECDLRGVVTCLVHETRLFRKAFNGLDKNLKENVSECTE